ncbi:MAG: Holliday junction DNA helicase RuvA [Candidatus Zambryskibacteria bacterium RIFOXYD1_FULL_40_13]|nr:MAG: Holliday junction ATP-dependent DNA helicase RuvA [Parcubacteria group bacterium GW2011_GWC1_39_12]KKR19499.1 MAG: Holliday junction ATP-dependent DNA helicase RuvA [Parcubacteria group bacterium GW2011_GWF1_39_37]KKR35125.1 MAG: Holliday junction ATP-dependent DNA helicase RuvA [Parcubacteria group bacterium GW2011_GWC2_40_10]KKR52448.1 MAG: Holliday junction ATP-dependent DNA helicase RuvA [Parcubacteria group bacterium GW2011_GWE1_40_20]KKR65907.1 MAG: Holliday junction ATP-dependent
MIGHLKGQIIYQDLKSIILDVSGVGYKIHTNTASLSSLERSEGNKSDKAQATTEYWTYLAVRENALDLYGFKTREELSFFELLLTVSGIGPKSALGILSVASLQNLRHAVVTGDTAHLVKVSGVGKKNAEKIVLELRDKLEHVGGDESSLSDDIDALEALKSLGYGEREAREALKKVSEEKNTGEKIKKAMKLLM